MKSIWIIFTVLFFFLAVYHFYKSFEKIKHLTNIGKIKAINGVSLGISEFVEEFNKYLDRLNRDNRNINIAQSIGYILAALTSFVSFLIS